MWPPPPTAATYAGDTPADGYADEWYADDGYGGDSYTDDAYDGHYDGRPVAHDRRPGGVVAAVRTATSEAAWRYSSAPLGARIAVDVVAAVAVLGLIAGLLLVLRPDGGTEQAGAGEPVVVATVPTTTTTTSTTLATTTTAPTTTTTAPTTTTTTPPPPTTEPPPAVPPPTRPPSPPTTERVRYDNCLEALFDGALPLREGDPGYGRHLDRDGDGEACEFGE